jgi:DUF2934 family protein
MPKPTMDVSKRSGSAVADPDHKSIEALAYELWRNRGCPLGSDQEDWFRAEEKLRKAKSVQRAA